MRFGKLPALLVLLFVVALAATADAQRAPRRPRLPDQADTNDATLYYELGLSRADRNAGQALDAFYWAARLDPMSPYPLYGQYAATLLLNTQRLTKYIQRDPRTLESREVLALDSLRLRAEMLDPFYHRSMETTLLLTYAQQANRAEGDPFNTGGRQTSGDRSQGDMSAVQGAAELYFERTDPYSRGALAYGVPDLRTALRFWALANRTHSVDWIWAERSRAFAELRQWDSALANIVTSLDSRRTVQDMGRRPWEQRAHWHFMMGRIYEEMRDQPNARAAYRSAVEYNVNHYPSLIRLAALHLAGRDTATALDIMIRVAEHPQAGYPFLTAAAAHLTQFGDHARATAAMRRATALEPYASAGWLILARSLEASRDTSGAVEAYQRYLALAPRNEGTRLAATRALTNLRPGGQ